ncbi:hypothetical protein F3K50_06195 [Pseudomonas marginalis]|nr:hypothetical protein F3K50_06195 [Pseudomonas marginalis]
MKKPVSSISTSLLRVPHDNGTSRPTDDDELEPPFVNDPVRPLPGAAFGLGLQETTPFLIVNILRWLQFSVGDSYKLYMGNDRFAIAAGEVRNEDLDKAQVQLVITANPNPGGPPNTPVGFVYPCFCEVIRSGSNTISRSPKQTWFIKYTRPGGVSRDPGLPYHTELIIHLPPDLENGVLDRERAKHGVELTIDSYPNITEGDTVEVYWNGYLITLTIDHEHVIGIKPITVLVPESTILQKLNNTATIRFRLYDTVFNFSGPEQQWSQALTLKTTLDPSKLEAPHFVVDGDIVYTVNLDFHADLIFNLEMVVPKTLPNGTATPSGALIVMKLKWAVNGMPFEKTLPPVKARIGLSTLVDVDRKDLEAVINGHMDFEYTLTTSTGVFLAISNPLTIGVSGTKSAMPAMRIEQDEGGNIDPEHDYIRAFFPRYTPYDRNYNVTLRMEAIRSGGGLVSYGETLLAGAEPPPERFRIVLQAIFARFFGLGPVRVYYLVDNGMMRPMVPGTQAIRKSDELIVTFGPRYAELPAPQMQYVDEFNNLDPDRIKGGQLQVTLPYTRTVPGDIFKWTLLGATSSGSASGEILINTGTAGRLILFILEDTLIYASLNREIRLSYSLVPASGGDTLYSEVLIVTVGQALDLLRPEVLQAQRYPDQLPPEAVLRGATIAVAYPQMLPSHRIRACWTGIPEVGTYCETKDGNTSRTVHFEVPPEVIGANLNEYGRYINVQYFVLLGTHQTPSSVLSLYVLPPVLPLPYLEGHTSSVLDVSTLIGTERAMVDRWSFINRNQRMWFELHGTYANDAPFFFALYNGDLVTYNGEQIGIRPQAPVSELRQLKDGSQLLMRFGVTFDQTVYDTNALWFPERRYTVQAIPAEFPVPRLVQATGSGTAVTLTALSAQYGATVEVPYSPMYTSDIITLEVRGTDGPGSAELGPKTGEIDGTVNFDLSAALIAANIGNRDTTFTVKYTVLRTGQLRSSVVLTVTLKAIPLAELSKTVIRIDEAANGVLNVDELIGDATARLGTWPFIARDQPVWLRLFGNKPDGTAHNLTLLNGAQGDRVSDGWLNQGYQLLTVLNTYLRDLGNGTRLSMQFKVALNHSTDEWKALEFPVVTYSILSLLISDKTPFTGGFMNGWISLYPKEKSIQREADGNYYLRHGPLTGDGVRIYKIYTPVDYGYYRVRFKYRINKFASIGGPTSMFIHLANLTRNIIVPNLNTWNYVDEYLGYWKGGNFQASIAVMNPTTGGIYDIDDVWIQQRHFPG